MRAITQIDAAADDRSSAMTISKIARRQTHQQSLERTSNHRKKSRSACASFPALIAVASGLIATTAMRTILVVGVDMIHKLTEPATLAAFCGATEPARLVGLRDRLTIAVRSVAGDAVVFAETTPRLPNTVCFGVPGVEAATLMIALDLAGIAASSGSACSSGKVAASHVLAAMGAPPELARGAIRLSLGWASGEADVERFTMAFASVMARMGAARRGAPTLTAEAAPAGQ